ncbi:hypothetical protein FQR65_LT02899 [Abscondita terminalis]|nr:hypothetical protein FQR65_LT02899 [Abscondita terminalis]
MFRFVSKLRKHYSFCTRNVSIVNFSKRGLKCEVNKFYVQHLEFCNQILWGYRRFPLLSQIRTNSSSNEKCVRHVYHKEIEKAVNKQIAIEFKAMFAYLSMASYFGRSDVALPGCYGFFMLMKEEEHDHAIEFINYQNLRGGKVLLENFEINKCIDWNLQSAFTAALELEKTVTEKLLDLNAIAEQHHDISVMEIISHQYIPDQEKSIFQISSLLKRLNKMAKDGVGEFLFDKEVHNAFVKKSDKSYTPNIPDGDGIRKNKYV